MPDIEIGEYVRLDYGKIGKVIAVEKGSIMLDIASNRWVGICCIVKHSKNIIDLIEVGDYVNACKVDSDCRGLIYCDSDGYLYYINDIEIKSIVTKEQFKQVQYEVGD